MSTSLKITLPWVIFCTPESARSSVVLPAPLAPTIATSSPSPTMIETPLSAAILP
jgi:hypothetical protein